MEINYTLIVAFPTSHNTEGETIPSSFKTCIQIELFVFPVLYGCLLAVRHWASSVSDDCLTIDTFS